MIVPGAVFLNPQNPGTDVNDLLDSDLANGMVLKPTMSTTGNHYWVGYSLKASNKSKLGCVIIQQNLEASMNEIEIQVLDPIKGNYVTLYTIGADEGEDLATQHSRFQLSESWSSLGNASHGTSTTTTIQIPPSEITLSRTNVLPTPPADPSTHPPASSPYLISVRSGSSTSIGGKGLKSSHNKGGKGFKSPTAAPKDSMDSGRASEGSNNEDIPELSKEKDEASVVDMPEGSNPLLALSGDYVESFAAKTTVGATSIALVLATLLLV